jgi:hypothetical protein
MSILDALKRMVGSSPSRGARRCVVLKYDQAKNECVPDYKGWFHGFTTVTETYPGPNGNIQEQHVRAIVETEKGPVHTVDIGMFQFLPQEDE